MANEKIQIDIGAEDDATKIIEKLAQKVEELEKEVIKLKVTADTDKAEADLDDVKDEAKEVDKLDPEVKVTADTGSAEAGLDGVRAKSNDAADSIHRVGDESDQSRSVLANLAGNAAQDMGELGGVAGTAGVAIGQLAEYATEGNIALSNLAATAGPMAAIILVAQLISYTINSMQEKARKAAEAEKLAADQAKAMAEGQREINDALAEGDIAAAARTFLDTYKAGAQDIPKIAHDLGISVQATTEAITTQADKAPILATRLAAIRSEMEGVDPESALGKSLKEQETAAMQAFTSLGFLQGKYRESGGAATAAVSAEEQVATALDNTAESAEGAEAAEQALFDSRRAHADSTWALQKAEDDLADAHSATEAAALNLIATNNDGTKTDFDRAAAAEALSEAQEAEADAAFRAAEAAQQQAIDQAASTGATLSAAEQQQVYTNSLIESARQTSGPTRTAIEQHIARILGIPVEKVTDILAQPTGTAEADTALDNVASNNGQGRDAPIKATAITAEAKRQLDELVAAYQAGAAPRHGQYGFDDVVSRPTLFMAGEHGFPERVRVTPGLGGSAAPAAVAGGPAQVHNYNIHLPRGTRGDDLVRTMANHARRNGAKIR